jgi:hypothetical protein
MPAKAGIQSWAKALGPRWSLSLGGPPKARPEGGDERKLLTSSLYPT